MYRRKKNEEEFLFFSWPTELQLQGGETNHTPPDKQPTSKQDPSEKRICKGKNIMDSWKTTVVGKKEESKSPCYRDCTETDTVTKQMSDIRLIGERKKNDLIEDIGDN